VVATQNQWELPALPDLLDGSGEHRAGGEDLREISSLLVNDAGDLGDLDRHVAPVLDRNPETGQAGIESRVAHGARTHVDTSSRRAQVERRAHDSDLHRLIHGTMLS
jgi:hypothetical protein